MNCVYKITHPILEGKYFGSTEDLETRKRIYKSNSINNCENQLILSLMNLWGFETFEFEIVENNLEGNIRIREQFYINKYGLDNLYNERNAFITEEERIEYRLKYTNDNRESINISNNIRNRGKVICECGTKMCYDSRSRHIKTPKHKRLILELLYL